MKIPNWMKAKSKTENIAATVVIIVGIALSAFVLGRTIVIQNKAIEYIEDNIQADEITIINPNYT